MITTDIIIADLDVVSRSRRSAAVASGAGIGLFFITSKIQFFQMRHHGRAQMFADACKVGQTRIRLKCRGAHT